MYSERAVGMCMHVHVPDCRQASIALVSRLIGEPYLAPKRDCPCCEPAAMKLQLAPNNNRKRAVIQQQHSCAVKQLMTQSLWYT